MKVIGMGFQPVGLDCTGKQRMNEYQLRFCRSSLTGLLEHLVRRVYQADLRLTQDLHAERLSTTSPV